MIITLCGSARFEEFFHSWNEKLTFDGHTVFGLTVYPSMKAGKKEWYSTEQKEKLDAAHIRKIDASDAIFVVSGVHGRYIGESTKREIAHAERTGKAIFYSEECCSYPGCFNRLFQKPPCALCYE